MKYYSLIILLTINISIVNSQSICIGEKIQIYSTHLNEEREILIHLPDSYLSIDFNDNHFPVLYVLDGERLFNQTVTIVDALSKGMYRYLPEMIVVGIINTDRSRDLTPSNDTILHNNIPIHGNSGGAESFRYFLESELGNYINQHYRTNGFNILSGHSFGGLFTIYSFLNQSNFFSTFLAHDPSLWWDNQSLIESMEVSWSKISFDTTSLYLSVAAKDTIEKDRFNHTESILKFQQFFDEHPKNSLNFKSEYFANEDHGTITIPGTFYGLRAMFSGITLPVKKIPFNTSLIEETYLQLSNKLGSNFLPESNLLDELAKYCKKVKQYQAELEIRKMHVRYYPNSSYAHSALAEYYYHHNMKDLGDKHKEISTLQKQS
nr:alpha/beta hydrolase-fold protein [uncultured Carboxylicivirga sp.]